MTDDAVPPEAKTCDYFVDEAGDPVLFNRRKKIVVGTEGCSNYFMLGLAHVPDAASLAADFDALRRRLLADAYLNQIPSMQLAERKTAIAFHAKDDVPEVRREVFQLLMRHEIKFFAVVRDKHAVVSSVLHRNERNAKYRYTSCSMN